MITKIANLQQKLKDGQGALIHSPENRFYLTGFPSSDGEVLITKTRAVFFVDFRYYEKAKSVCRGTEVVLLSHSADQTAYFEPLSTVFVETERVTVADFEEFKKRFGEKLSLSDWLDRTLREMRAVKDEIEVAAVKEAQRMTDETFSYILPRLTAGRTEREVMLDMEFYLRRLGSEGVSFDFIVVSGKNSSLPHGVPTDKKIERGDFVTMDFGAVYRGYRSDMTRTVAVGCCSDEMSRVYQTVLAAQEAAFANIRPGAVCKEVDAAARTLIDKAGYAGRFGHGLGHAVGVEIHEYPMFNTRCEEGLKPGMLMTVEPGIYLENQFGVRVEDMVLITDEGYENLTHSPKDLLIV